MANRYAVGLPFTWDATAGVKWSTTDGGAGGAAVPTSSDDVFFTALSGAGTCTISGSRVAKSLTCTGFTGTLTANVSQLLTVSGNVTLASTGTFSGSYPFHINANCAFTSGGATMTSTIHIDNGAVVTLQDNYTLNNTIDLSQGTFDANNKNVSCNSLSSANTNVRALTMGSGVWTFSGGTGAWDTSIPTNMTITVGASTVNFTNSLATIFIGAGETLKFSANQSFTSIRVDAGGIDANNKDVTLSGSLTMNDNISSAAKTLSMGTGTWTMSGAGTVWTDSGAAVTITPSSSTIKLTDASASSKTFDGNSKTYNNIWLTGAGTGAFIIQGSNTFNDFKVDTPPHTVQFESGSTQIVTTFTVDGTSGAAMMTLQPVGAAHWNLTCVAGTSRSYLVLRGSHAHGGAFVASNSFDAGDNFNWDFVLTQSDVIYFDSAYQYSGASISVVSGLNWLIGETLGVMADGVDIGDATVTAAGNLTLPDSVTATEITVGKRYLSRAVTLRAPTAGNQDGSAIGRRKIVSEVFADLLNSGPVQVGTLTRTRELPRADKQTNPGDFYTGMFSAAIDDSHKNEGVLVIETDSGYPATVRAVQFALDGAP